MSEDDLDDDDSDVEANILYESIYAAEACLETLLTILDLNLDPAVRAEANNSLLCIMADTLLENNHDLLIKAIGILNFMLYKEQAGSVTQAMSFFFPILCYIIAERPQNQQLREEAKSLPENFCRVLLEVDLGALNENTFAGSLCCLMNFITKIGPGFASQTDYYGNTYIDLLYNTFYKVVKDCLTGPSDTEIILALRLVICLLEQSKDKWEVPRFQDFLDVALSLSEWKRTDKLALNIL